MGRSVLVGIQHEEGKKRTREADAELSKGKNNVSNDVDLPYAENVIEDKLCCYC